MPVNLGGGGHGYQLARNGFGYVVMFYYNGQDGRNYIAVKLKDSLRQGKCYYAEYYVNLFNTYKIGCNSQSMLFTNTAAYVDTATPNVYLLPATPQITNYGNPVITDTLNWVKVSGVFTAQGGEKYLTLGNFRNNAQTSTQQIQTTGYNGAAYYLDDVSVIPLDSLPLKADAGPDRTIAPASSTYIGSYTNGLSNTIWYNALGIAIATNVPGLNVTPAASTYFVMEQTVCGNYSRDTVYVNVGVVPLAITKYELRSTKPEVGSTKGKALNIWETANEVNVSHFNIQRSNDGIHFQTIAKVIANNTANNSYQFTDGKPLNGTSYYRLEAVDKDGKVSYSKVLSIALSIQPLALSIYPNPAKGKVHLVSTVGIHEIVVNDLVGRTVLKKQFNQASQLELDIASLFKGIYLLKVLGSDGHWQTDKLVVE